MYVIMPFLCVGISFEQLSVQSYSKHKTNNDDTRKKQPGLLR